ncbi:hypothetical protein [Kitasatospora sp. NPDC057015]|uniref:hypothetical protein n=1 Tax=Kitasatospora sp. NPDC057015 TaxID=3346001 RepID=UPI00364588DC
MTQHGYTGVEVAPFAAAEQVSATLGSLAAALLDGRATRYPLASLTALRGRAHAAAEALFTLRPGGTGTAHQSVHHLGTVVSAGTAGPSPAPRSERAAATLLARFGGGEVRGASPGPSGPTAARFELPVTGEAADPALRPVFTAALAELAGGQQTRQTTDLAAGEGAEVRLVVPSVFHPLTAPDAGGDLAVHLAEVTEEVFSGTGPAQRRDFAVLGATLADLAAAAGVRFAGLSALTVDGRPSDASLVVSLTRHPSPIQVLATELATARPDAEVWTVLLPAGPAAVLVEGRSVPVPGRLAEDGRRRWVVTSVVEAFVPLPDGVSVLCVQLATAHTRDWELYTGVFAELLKSIQFAWDGVVGSPAQAPVQAQVPVQAAPAAAAPAVAAPPVVQAAGAAVEAAAVAVEPPADPALRGTPVRIPPADFNPFAPQAEIPAQAAAEPAATRPASAEPPLKGTPVRIPPPDFNPFAPVADAPAAEPEQTEPVLKGTPVRIPPPDFNPFAPLPAEPAPAAQAAPAATRATDPFGTVTADQPSDPFGTKLPSAAPAPVAAPPMPSSPPAVAPAADGAAPKGTPVRIPPPDFNPFAPMADVPAAEPEQTEPPAPQTSPFG